ncbi:uncharacterized protein LOC131855109 [Achroia grisella]|uniref:uncharacterized protein LOC131855109 n=1 Tax=Achroia grisella TaxID=688607 RepID=UPI0027D25D86|nr:uncharacterized protein LOC131855109 [Achroia grisella]XP_059062319.1 uncharacterized protein LOC131855109 [Achroia grisella]
MYRLVLITAATTATAVLQPCTDYCESLFTGANNIWRPDCVCSTNDSMKPISMPRSEIKPAFQHGDTAVYYEPAEHVPSERVSFVYHPFFILNPTFKRHAENDVNAQSNGRPKYKLKANIVHNSNTQPGELPLYLDVSVQDTVNPRSSVKEFDTKDFKLIEQNLLECIDLHILIYSRQNNNITKLKEIWGDNKFKKYDNMSNSDIMIEIQSKCGQPASIVKESLNEIKMSLPKKNTPQYKSAQKDLIDEIITAIPMLKNNSLNFNRSDELSFTTTENTNFKDETTTSQDFDKSHSVSNNKSKTISTRSTSMNTSNNQDSENRETLTSTVEPIAQYYEDNITSPRDTFSTQYTKEENLFSVTPIKIENMTEKEYLGKYTKTYDKSSNKNRDIFFTASTNSPITQINTVGFTLTDAPKDILQAETSTENTDIKDPANKIKYDDTQTKDKVQEELTEFNSIKTATNNRTLYPDDDIKLSKVIVKEYSNDTVVSEVAGNELLRNNDFIYDNSSDNENLTIRTKIDNLKENYSNDTSPSASTYNDGNYMFDINKRISITTTTMKSSEIQESPQYEITGKLYFYFNRESIPVQFVQKTDGNINVGLDGISLCNELNNSVKSKSTLLTILCNCAKSSNCTTKE